MIEIVVNGRNATQFNGPLELPWWDGEDGMRAGQIAWDLDGDLDGDPGEILWDGTQWTKAVLGIPDLQAVTEQGSDTNISIQVHAQAAGDNRSVSVVHDVTGSLAQLSAFQAGSPTPVGWGQLLLQGGVTRIVNSTGINMQFADDSANVYFTILSNGKGTMDKNGVTRISGTGDPNGIETAIPGSSFSRTDGSPGETYYIKQSGTGSTGWAPIA